MAKPSVTTKMKVEWPGFDSQIRQWETNLWDVIADSYYTTRTGSVGNKALPKPGDIRIENSVIGTGPYEQVWCDGRVEFQWCLNRSGGTLNQFDLVSRPANTTGLVATGGSVFTITDTGLIADELTHALMTLTADAGGGTAAPENESAYIAKNTAILLELQPDLSAAIANLDQYDVYFPYNIEASAAGDEASEVQGIVVSPDNIEDNYWGWVAYKGRIWAETEGALTVDKAIIAATGEVAVSSTSPFNLIIGWAPTPVTAAQAKAMVELQCGPAAQNRCVSA